MVEYTDRNACGGPAQVGLVPTQESFRPLGPFPLSQEARRRVGSKSGGQNDPSMVQSSEPALASRPPAAGLSLAVPVKKVGHTETVDPSSTADRHVPPGEQP
jgi:hypothetical protein